MCRHKYFFKKSHGRGFKKKKKANKQTLEDAAEPPCSRNKTPGGCNSSGSATPDRSFQLSLLTAERFLGEKRQAEKRGGCGRSEDLILEILHSREALPHFTCTYGTPSKRSPPPPNTCSHHSRPATLKSSSSRNPTHALSGSLHQQAVPGCADLGLRARPAPASPSAASHLGPGPPRPLPCLGPLGASAPPGGYSRPPGSPRSRTRPASRARAAVPALSPRAPRAPGPHPLLQLILRACVLWLVQVYVKHSCHVLSFPVSEVRRWVKAVPPPSSPHGPGPAAATAAAAAITGCLGTVRLRLGPGLAPQVQRWSMRTRFCEAELWAMNMRRTIASSQVLAVTCAEPQPKPLLEARSCAFSAAAFDGQ